MRVESRTLRRLALLRLGLARRVAALLVQLVASLRALLLTLGEQLGVVGRQGLLLLAAALLECKAMTLALQSLRGHQTLDLRRLGVGLLALLLNLAADDVLAHICNKRVKDDQGDPEE